MSNIPQPGPVDPETREDVAIQHVTEALTEDYGEGHPPAEIEHVVEEAHERYADAPVRDFVPIMVERDAREELDPTD